MAQSWSPLRRSMASSSSSSLASHRSLSDAARANICAQGLNNSACSCIEVGQHQRALFSLNRALELVRIQERRSGDIVPCRCYGCTLAGCIVNTENLMEESNGNGNDNGNNDNDHDNDGNNNDDNSSTDATTGYISRRPIRVGDRGHTMGPVLQLVIVYNIGLAGHLRVLGGEGGATGRFLRIARLAIESYRLALDLQQNHLRGQQHRNNSDVSERRRHRDDDEGTPPPRNGGYDDDDAEDPTDAATVEPGGGRSTASPFDAASSVASLRFEMRIFNNAGQLYKKLHLLHHCNSGDGSGNGSGNRMQRTGFADHYESCRRQVLSIIMIIADHQVREGGNGISSNWRLEIEGCLGNILHVVLAPEYTAVSA